MSQQKTNSAFEADMALLNAPPVTEEPKKEEKKQDPQNQGKQGSSRFAADMALLNAPPEAIKTQETEDAKLASYHPSQIPQVEHEFFAAEKDPVRIKRMVDIQPGLATTPDQDKILWDANRAKSLLPHSLGEAAQDVSFLATGMVPLAAHALWKMGTENLVPGAVKLAENTGDTIHKAGSLAAATTEERPAKQKEFDAAKAQSWQDATDLVSNFPEMGKHITQIAGKMIVGGTGLSDRIMEGISQRTEQESFKNWQMRRDMDRLAAIQQAENPSEWGQLAHNASSIMVPAMAAVSRAIGPDPKLSAKIKMKADPTLTQEQADKKVEEENYANAKGFWDSTIEEENAHPTDRNIQLIGSLATPLGNEFAVGGKLWDMGKLAGSTAKNAFRFAKLSPVEIESLRAADTAKLIQAEAENVAKASKQGIVGTAATKTADAIDRGSERVKGILENIPEPLKKWVPLAASTATGAVLNPDNREAGALEGLGIGFGLKALYKGARITPRFFSDLSKGKALSAGGSTGMFETTAANAESSAATKALLGKIAVKGKDATGEATTKIVKPYNPKALDWIGNNVKDWVRLGVEPIPLVVGMGAIDSQDPQQMADAYAQGIFFMGGGHLLKGGKNAITRIMGGSPEISARRRAEQGADIQKTLLKVSPEARARFAQAGDWDNVIVKSEAELGKANDAFREALAKHGAGSKEAHAAEKHVDVMSAAHKANMSASPETRLEFYRQTLLGISEIDRMVSGSLRPGQNVGIELLSTQEIFDKLRANNPSMSDADLMAIAKEPGIHFKREGGIEFKPGQELPESSKGVVFDPLKQTMVVNADHVESKANLTGKSLGSIATHEAGHVLNTIPEYKLAIQPAKDILFKKEFIDVEGNVHQVADTGIYGQKELVDLFNEKYLKNYDKDQVNDFAKKAGLWDMTKDELDPRKTANYMGEEIMADLGSHGFHTGLDRVLGPQNAIFDWARATLRNSFLGIANYKSEFAAKDPFKGTATGVEFSEDALYAQRQALRALADYHGEFSPNEGEPDSGSKITRAETLAQKALLKRYGLEAGLVKTQSEVTILDKDGKPVGKPVVLGPTGTEGSWVADSEGKTRQTKGYGPIPEGIVVPPGGSVHVENKVVYHPDGETPVQLTPKEAKELAKNRGQLIREALDNTPDVGAPNRFRPISPGNESYTGTFTPLQIEAIKALPESIVPLSIKEKILKFNESLTRKDGTRWIVDYAARILNGSYKAFAPKIYDVVPIGMGFSKDNNFFVRVASVSRMFNKLNLWDDRTHRLSLWNGDKVAFFNDFTKYLANWQKGEHGEVGLDPDTKTADQKKLIFNDFLNYSTKETEHLNPDRTRMPRLKGERKLAPSDQGADRTIMTMRLDAVADMMESNATKLPIDYEKAKINFMPAPAKVSPENPSLKEIDGVSAKDIFERAKKRHGVTNSVYEAGYVLPDGTMLDFSGKADAGFERGKDGVFRPKGGEKDWMKDQRSTDHREIEWEGMPQYKETFEPMVDFLRLGAIRIDANSGTISMHSREKPTRAQEGVLKSIVVGAGNAYLDLEDDTGARASLSLDSGKWGPVNGMLTKWANGETPEYKGPSFMPAPAAGDPELIAPSGMTSEDFEIRPKIISKYRAVAMKQGDKIIEGNPGDNHASIAERYGFPNDMIPGFITKDGQFHYQFEEDAPKQPERVTDAQYTHPDTGETTGGSSHFAAAQKQGVAAPEDRKGSEGPDYTFGTDSGRKVDRNEAAQIAEDAGQIKKEQWTEGQDATGAAVAFMPKKSAKTLTPDQEDVMDQLGMLEREAKARKFDTLEDFSNAKKSEYDELAERFRAYRPKDKENKLLQPERVSVINTTLYGTRNDTVGEGSGVSSEMVGGTPAAGDRGGTGTALTLLNAMGHGGTRKQAGGSSSSRSQREDFRGEEADYSDAARKLSLLIPKMPEKFTKDSPEDKGKTEHHAWLDPDSNRWVKLTKGSGMPMGWVVDPAWPYSVKVIKGTPTEWLQCLIDWNNLFGDSRIVHGVFDDGKDIGFVSSQAHIEGKAIEDPGIIASHMWNAGFAPLGEKNFYRSSDNTLVYDLNAGNVFLVGDTLVPIDGGVVHPAGELLRIVKQMLAP